MMRRRLILLGCALLAACAAQRPQPNAFEHIPDHYVVSGRFSVKDAKGTGYSASFDWNHQGSHDQLDITNMLGQTMARIELDPAGAHYFGSDGKARSADDIAALTDRELGWQLPAEGLRYWLLGLADPARDAQWGSSDTGPTLEQDGWHIQFDATPPAAPKAINLTRPEVRVRILVSDWQLSDAAP